MSDVNTKLDFVMQQQAETMKALKSIEQSNQRSASMSDPLTLNKKVTFAQSAISENEQQNERQYYRRESPARSVSPSERRNNDFRTSSMRSQSPVRYNSSANNNMSNGGRTSNQRRDARNVSANRQVWRQQRQWSTTPPTGMQPQGPQAISIGALQHNIQRSVTIYRSVTTKNDAKLCSLHLLWQTTSFRKNVLPSGKCAMF
jgi:hypothetical protein